MVGWVEIGPDFAHRGLEPMLGYPLELRLGGISGLRRLAEAWRHRVMADDVVSHAFSHGFHPQHVERLAAYWGVALGGPATYSGSYVTKPLSSRCTP